MDRAVVGWIVIYWQLMDFLEVGGKDGGRGSCVRVGITQSVDTAERRMFFTDHVNS